MPDIITAPAETESLSNFIKIGNALQRGETVEATPPVEPAITINGPALDAPIAEPKAEGERNPDGTFKKAAKARHDPGARVEQAIAKQRDAERLAQTEKESRLRLEGEIAALRATPKSVAIAPVAPITEKQWERYAAMPDAPKLSDFQSYEDYTFAVNVFVADQRFDERMSQHTAQQAERAREDAHRARIIAAKNADPQFEAKINAAGELMLSQPMIDLVKDSDIGPKLLLYFADHPDETQRLSTLPPAQVIRQLGRLEESLSRSDAAKHVPGPAPSPVISAATTPITPVGGSPIVSDADDEDEANLPLKKFIAVGNARDPKITPRAAHR